MKKFVSMIAAFVLVMAAVVGYDSQLVPSDEIGVQPTGVVQVDYCVWETTAHVNPVVGMDVTLDDICEDTNGAYGCQPSESGNVNPGEFDVAVLDSPTGDDGCVTLEITTNNADGQYYFSLNGWAGVDDDVSVVTEETGHVFIPEFGILASVMVLGLAGLYIQKKRN